MTTIYTDGSCVSNPGPGGWAAIVVDASGQERVLVGSEPDTTNNRMELRAALEALSATAGPVAIYSDSTYLVKGASIWLPGWKRKQWRTATDTPIKNHDLWQAMDGAMAGRCVSWHWIRGHAGHPHNERCDALAETQAQIEAFAALPS